MHLSTNVPNSIRRAPIQRWAATRLLRFAMFVLFASMCVWVCMPESATAQDTVGSATLMAASPTAPFPQEESNNVVTQKRGINFLSLLTQGGWFMVPLLALSIVVVTIGIERFLALRREKVFPPELVDQLSLLSQSEGGLIPRRAFQACQRYPSSAAYILRSMLVKVGRPQLEIENAVSEASQREANRLTQMTSWLSLAAAIAPLIGLLGTVWGITQAFHDVAQLSELNPGANRGEALATGIYIALVTTMVGLMIAIPAAVLSHFFENRIVQLLNEIEEMAYNLLPQFERYEGQVRFTEGLRDSSADQNPGLAEAKSTFADSGENGADSESGSKSRKRNSKRVAR